MTKFRTLMLTTVLSGFVALPALALTLETGTGLSLGAGIGSGGSAVAGAGVAADGSVMAEGMANDNGVDLNLVSDSAFAGNVVMTSDGMEIGQVDEVWLGTDGNARVFVKLTETNDDAIERFMITVKGDASADGTIQLGWSEAELMAALKADAMLQLENNG